VNPVLRPPFSPVLHLHFLRYQSSSPRDGAGEVLDGAEWRRVDALRFAVDRERLVQRLQWRRRILARYLGIGAGEVSYATLPGGKPLVRTPEGRPLHFSTSATSRGAILVVSGSLECGVDLVDESDLSPLATYARAIDGAATGTAAASARGAAQLARRWSRKEALVKAEGTGLVGPVPLIEVPDAADRWAQPLPAHGGPRRFLHYDLPTPIDEHHCSLVLEQPPTDQLPKLIFHRWPSRQRSPR
jgi:4'-phosphopantetheinyl transferase